MATIIWDEIGKRYYETGVSKGVFYDSDGYGVAWNGLTSIEENTKYEVQPVYFDGLKFNDIVTVGDFSATLKAFTYPDEFLPYEGVLQDLEGLFITGQQGDRFGLSYQTIVGNDLEGLDLGYKLHILYNLTAIPSQKSYNTLTLDTEPNEFEWEISAVPEFIENYRPTSHIILDSRTLNSDLLADIEETLYGNDFSDAFLPPLKSLNNYMREWKVIT